VQTRPQGAANYLDAQRRHSMGRKPVVSQTPPTPPGDGNATEDYALFIRVAVSAVQELQTTTR